MNGGTGLHDGNSGRGIGMNTEGLSDRTVSQINIGGCLAIFPARHKTRHKIAVSGRSRTEKRTRLTVRKI